MDILANAYQNARLTKCIASIHELAKCKITLLVWKINTWKIVVIFDEGTSIHPKEIDIVCPECFIVKKDKLINPVAQGFFELSINHTLFKNVYIKKFTRFPCYLIFANFDEIDISNTNYSFISSVLHTFYKQQLSYKSIAAQKLRLENISHSIRTPLHGILHMNTLIQTSYRHSPADIPKYLNFLNSLTMGLANNISDIIDTAKLDLSVLMLKPVVFSVKTCIEKIINVVKITAVNKFVDIKYYICKTVSTFVYADSQRIKQIIITLLQNSVKLTEKGEIILYITGVDNHSKISFIIKDTGIGYTKNEIKHIFTQPKMRLAQELALKMNGNISIENKGTLFEVILDIKKCKAPSYDIRLLKHLNGKTAITYGPKNKLILIRKELISLGMIVEEINFNDYKNQLIHTKAVIGILYEYDDLHNIKKIKKYCKFPLIGFSNTHCKLKIFTRILNKNIATCGLSHAVISILTSDKLPHNSNINILIAEDVYINTLILEKLLHSLGYTSINSVTNGKLALEEIIANPSFYDLILMDLNMPLMTGETAAKKIHEFYTAMPNEEPRIIGITATLISMLPDNIAHRYIKDFLIKPIEKNDLQNLMATVKKIGL